MSTQEKFLPYIISILIPGLNFINKNPFEKDKHIVSFTMWALVSIFLFALWKTIDRLMNVQNRSLRGSYILLCTGCMIFAFVLLTHYVFPSVLNTNVETPILISVFRLSLANMVFITIIQNIRTTKENDKIKIENFSLQTENIKAELNQLRQQVNPHFLFNCLSTLRSMVRTNDPQSEEYILKLSDVYRQILQNRESIIVTLKEELAFLNSYTYLMKLRHENALFFDINILDESLTFSLPIFSMQLLVENCIKHNIVSESKPLYIKIYQKENASICITNNYQPKKIAPESMGIGLENLRKRYELIGLPDGIQIENTGTEFIANIKLF